MEDDKKDESTFGRRLEGNAIDDMGSPEFIPPPPDVPQSTPTKPSAFKSYNPDSKSSGPSLKNFSKSLSEKRSSVRSVPRVGSKTSKHTGVNPIAELPLQERDQQGSLLRGSSPSGPSDLNPPSFERNSLNATVPSNFSGSPMPPSDVSGSMNVVPPTSINMNDQNVQNSLNYTGFPNVNDSTEPEFMTLNSAPPSNVTGVSNASNQPDFLGPPVAQAQPNSLEYSNAGNLLNLPGGQMPPTSPNMNVTPNAAVAPRSPIMNAQSNAPATPNTPNLSVPPNAAMAPNAPGFQNIPGQPNAVNFQNVQGPQNNVGFQNMGTSQNTPDVTAYMGLNGGPTDANKSGGGFPCASALLQKRSPFIHNPPRPEERRPRIPCPRTPREYLINLREDLADFQESHGLPRTRDYSFVSLGLALAQETGRAIYSVFIMLTEMFPVLAIISLIMRFALDKLIEILETTETMPKVKKTVIFALEMLVIMIPLWILVGTIIIPLLSLLLSIIKRMLQIRGGKRKSCKSSNKTN